LTDDLGLQKRIAEEAQVGPGAEASPAVRAFQFFLVPLLIVGVCVGVFFGFRAVVSNPRGAGEWLKDIEEGGPNARNHAALQLVQNLRAAEQPEKGLAKDVIKAYRASDPKDEKNRHLRVCLITALGILRDDAASDLLLELAKKDEDVELRAVALDSLGAVKDPATLPDLVKLLDDPNPLVRKYAAFNAGAVAEKAGERGVVEPLRKLLKDPSPDVGWNAAFALAYFLGDGSGTDTLRKMLDRKYLGETIPAADPHRDTLSARAMVTACNAAAKLRDRSFLPLLRSMIDPKNEPDPDVRFIANKAIHEIERN
jgi:HEAT repeat protein